MLINHGHPSSEPALLCCALQARSEASNVPHLARVGHGVDLASDGVELQLQLKKVNGDSVAGMSFDEAVRLPP